MCGIAGVTGASDALQYLIDSLFRLEYRGYDSAGIALQTSDGIWRVRAATGTTSIKSVKKLADELGYPVAAGIGHTRWATHGRPSEDNAHPHLDCSGRIAVVHNGIIENHVLLSDELAAEGHELTSETDTEVVAHLIEDGMADGLSLTGAVRRCLERIRGHYALVVISSDEPELLVAARSVSPLVAGISKGMATLASDIPALLSHATEIFALEDGQLAEVWPGKLVVSSLAGDTVLPRSLQVNWTLEEAKREGFEDYMAKEMHEQPRAISDTLLGRMSPQGRIILDETRFDDDELREVEKVFVVACGSSYHAGLVAKYALEHWARLPVEIDIASEFRYRDPVLDSRTLVVGVSQSGETLDTLMAMREAAYWNSKLLVITNVVDSSMAREAHGVLYTRAGPEIGVAATKTHLTQMIALELLALYLAQLRGTLYPAEVAALIEQLNALPEKVQHVLEEESAVKEVALSVASVRDFFFIGRHVGFPVALEGALKLKEISYLRAEGYPAGELKHGPIALIEPGTVVVAVATRTRLWDKLMANIAEVKARGATVIAVANYGDQETAEAVDQVLWVPETNPLFAPVVDVVPLQLLAYHLAKAHGHDVDHPRNLAKTVTVE
ncbi:MAG: glutamine--fructose-6-phosphate transaminase (isomerizing) [Actinobacteria bacterium]|nr:glutamine--fructose-6-phosphate transaminase (isomerizing) [Actinomycetota bacterium]